jgi:rhodanese-related sulfurtransferase
MTLLHTVCIVGSLVTLFGISLFGASSASECKVLDVDAAYELIETSGTDLQILDVRTPEEFQSGHIHNATNVNVRDPDFAEQISMFKEDMPILAYCKSGVRSQSAGSILVSKGFKEVYHMKGGIEAWLRAGYPVE